MTMAEGRARLTPTQRTELNTLNRTRWWERGACRGADLALFDAPDSHPRRTGAPERKRIAAAKAICARCEVVAECLADSVLLPDPSIRGGLTAAERRAQRKAQR